ncbi:MAG: multicopper oxidase domain-containing protein [Melioribacteraceae bacterium]|nr:multicopper oxidase domain-containing protein [Melioribacteraceae bacterium]MDD3558280.1 multicopper oxidase domain-containing protein [Melioribacteraceae bacterium]
MNTSKITRKNFLKVTCGTSALMFLPGFFLNSCENDAAPNREADPSFIPDIEFELTAHRSDVSILPGAKTKVWKYSGKVISGRKDALQTLDDNYLGPIFRVKTGDKIRVRFKSELDEITIVHWHGLHVPEEMDGHPKYVIEHGEKYVYEFEVKDRAGTYWFHPHPHELTGPQVYSGLAGLFIVSDKEEQKLNLPSGKDEIPIVIQDRIFDSDNQLVYINSPMDRMTGFLGDQIVANGKSNFSLDLDTKAYRLRLLNGSNSRIYKLAWSDGTPFTVIGTDGGLLEKPVEKEYLTFGPAERFDIIVDFSDKEPGDEIKLISLPFPSTISGMGGMMDGGMMGRGMMGGNRNSDQSVPDMGSRLQLLSINIRNKVASSFRLPSKLSTINYNDPKNAVNYNDPKKFVFGMGSHMRWTINNRTFEMNEVADYEKVKLNTSEVWEFVNGGGGRGMMGGMMEMPHPVHIHGLQFKIIERINDGGFDETFDSFKEGFVDEGWKDSFLLLPGTRVKVLLRFEDFTGMYLYHCHNLEHEDMGMMRNYLVE